MDVVAARAGTAPDSVIGVRPAVKRIGTFWREALMRPFSEFAVPTPTCTIIACGRPLTIAYPCAMATPMFSCGTITICGRRQPSFCPLA